MTENERSPTIAAFDDALLRVLLGDPDAPLFVCDCDLRVLRANEAFASLTGRQAEALSGRPLDAPGTAAAALRGALRRALAQSLPQRVDTEWPRDGATQAVEFQVDLVAGDGGPWLVGRGRDLSAQREAEKRLLASERTFRAVIENAPDVIMRYGLDGRVVYCNREIARHNRVEPQQMIGRRRGESMTAGSEQRLAYEQAVDRALAAGESSSLEIQIADPEGVLRTHSIAVVAERGDGGAVTGALAVGRDITEFVRLREELAARERDFRTLAENSPDNIIRYGVDGRAIYCNKEIEERVTVRAAGIVGRTPAEAAPPGMQGVEAYEAQLARTLATGEGGSVQLGVPHPSGELRLHSVVFAAEHDASGAIRGAVAVGRDVTDLLRMQQVLASKEREFRTLAENAGDNIARWGPDARMRYANPAMARALGGRPEAVLGLTPGEAMGERAQPAEDAIRRVAANGREEMLELHFSLPGTATEQVHQIRLVPERDASGAVVSVLGIGRDITEKMAQLELIESLLHTDPLTQLANRRALQQQAAGVLAAAARHGHGVAVLLIDLDQFKAINDGIGHSAGDALLHAIARRLRVCLRADDLLVRLGGDEFVVLAPDLGEAERAAVIAGRLHAALADPVQLGEREVRTTASIGVAVYPQDGGSLEDLLANADAAMYAAKRAGRARTEYYRAELGEAVRRRLLLEQTLRHACDGSGLALHFQPQVSLQGVRRVVGAEALLRWQHPLLGPLHPDAFINVAEESGLICRLGRWVMHRAAALAASLNRGRAEALRVSVNVSTRQFADDDLPGLVDEALAREGCDPRWLGIEITESALLHDAPRVGAALERVRARGVLVALDDFGTGYSALNYLARFPIDWLKIDKSFVQRIGCTRRDDELVKAFIAMADALNLTLVAEGVETEAQETFLSAQGCALAQGWRFGRPAAPEALLEAGRRS